MYIKLHTFRWSGSLYNWKLFIRKAWWNEVVPKTIRQHVGKAGSRSASSAALRAPTSWCLQCQTMLGDFAFFQVFELAKSIFETRIRGDFVETGVWRGGMSIFMQGMLFAYGEEHNRSMHVCDSFEGLPAEDKRYKGNDAVSKAHLWKFIKVSKEEVIRNFQNYDLLLPNVYFVKGFFKESMPELRSRLDTISLLRLDGDMFSSTWEVLEALYFKVSLDGYVIIDDWHWESCRRAVVAFRKCVGEESIIYTSVNSDPQARFQKTVITEDIFRNEKKISACIENVNDADVIRASSEMVKVSYKPF